MTEPAHKDGWPLTKQFADGLTAFASRFTEGVLALHELALTTMEVAIVAHEATVIAQAKVHYANERGSRPTFWELHQWAKDTGRPQIAAFLYANRRNPRITGLFGTEQPSIEPPEGS